MWNEEREGTNGEARTRREEEANKKRLLRITQLAFFVGKDWAGTGSGGEFFLLFLLSSPIHPFILPPSFDLPTYLQYIHCIPLEIDRVGLSQILVFVETA